MSLPETLISMSCEILILFYRGNYLYLRRSFHEGLRSDAGDAGDWERLPLALTLQKLRLENTKVSAF